MTRKDATTTSQRLNLALSWPLAAMLAVLALTLAVRYLAPVLTSGIAGWRPTYEGEGLMLSWNLYNGLMLAVALLACVDQPIRRGTDRFPIRRIGCLEANGQRLWGTTSDLSEEGASFALEDAQTGLVPGPAQLQLMEPSLTLSAEVERTSPTVLALRFRRGDTAADTALLGLIYSSEHWVHGPKRLSTSDALLHWLGTLWRPDPILHRFDQKITS